MRWSAPRLPVTALGVSPVLTVASNAAQAGETGRAGAAVSGAEAARGEADVAVTWEAPRGGKRALCGVSVSVVLLYEDALAESLSVGGGCCLTRGPGRPD